jgi:CubicO group peptidase (beta-lactamase class C family)
LSLVVVKDGEIVYQKGFGMADGPKNVPATPDTVYNTWSMVKPMSAPSHRLSIPDRETQDQLERS